VKRDPYKLVGGKLERYEIQELIGIGGMGVVYRAQHEITKAKVAIKILRPDLTISNEEGVGFFFEEATKTVSLSHPMIVKVISADYTPDGSAYMVMEWLDGRTLDQQLKEQGLPSLQRVIVLLEQIADAITYAHRKKIIHRDLKPSNIMLVREENGEESIRVLDFGIAKVLSTTIGTNTRVAGTPYYISPEQTIAYSPIDQSADIYSLGVILYQLLTGQVPFEAESDGQVMDMHRSILPRPLREIRPDIPQAIEDVVLKALSKRPLDRFQTATDLARAFRQAANIASSELVTQCVDATSGEAVPHAEVYLNGKYDGRTDADGWCRKGDMTPRQYLIEVESPRYARFNRSVDLQPNEELTVVAHLERRQIGELIVSCNAPNASVEIAGRFAGETDRSGRFYLDSIAAGSHTIRLTHPRHLPAEVKVEVEIWKQAYASLQLELRPQHDRIGLVKRKIGAPVNRRLLGAAVAATTLVFVVSAIAIWRQTDPPVAKLAPPEGMVYIPGGTFQMGYGDVGLDNQSGPPHKVKVSPFFIDKYEVTIEAYQAGQNLSESKLPATGVTWIEADIYCRSLGKRLPTEEEWEFAARGADGRLYPWGNLFETDRANLTGKLAPVGSYPGGDSPFGVSDMSGNAMEWTGSDFKNYPGSAYQPQQCDEPCKVIRGGAYFDEPQNATTVFRKEYQPTALFKVKTAYAVMGFRCAKEIQ
jgi:serine/threonine protein kinase/formylglycine-generating enzyme required for sulfatase activity